MISATNMEHYMIIDGLEISPHLLEISELNNFKNGSLIISEAPREFIGTAKTTLKISCNVHGAGWEWGTPWLPTIATLKRLGGCPKCKGNYRFSAEERIEQIDQLEGIEFKSFEGEYKGNTTRVNVFCHIHQFSWVATLANLLKGTGCSKCSGVYKHSEQERIDQINSLPNLQFISFPDGYKSGKSKALVRCLKDGYEWEVSMTGLIHKGRGCHKCSGTFVVKEGHVIDAIEKANDVTFVSFPDGYINSKSQVELNCSHCNIKWKTPSKNVISKSIKCSSCADSQEISTQLLEISKLKGFENGSLIISEAPREFIGTAKTTLKVSCNVHGAGWEWGTPWLPTIATLKRLGGCPKCKGNYRFSAEERIEQIDQLEGIEFKSFEGEYKGNTTRVNVFCHIHQFSWVATLANLLRGTGCSKCSGVYKHSKQERIDQINSLPNLQFISFPDGYKSGKSKALVRCLKDGYEWEVSVTGLIDKGRGCHKCSGSVRVKENDVICAIEKNGNVAFVSFPDGYLNSHSRVELNCSHCNLNWDMSSNNAILKPIKCPTCSDVKRIKTKEQALFLLKQLKGMKFLKFTEGFKNLDSIVKMLCLKNKEHIFDVKVKHALTLSGCKICSGRYVFSEDEQIRRLKSKDNFVFIELVDNYKDSHTKALIRCVKDGYEWTSTINRLVNSKSGCPKCAGNFQLSEKEVTKAINELPNSQFISFPDGYISQKDRVEVFCKKHDYIWVSNIHTAIKGMTGCGECRAEKVRLKRRTPKNDVINKINSLENIQFIDFDGDYINGYSNVKVKCLVDGNEWTPTIDNLANGRGCPKCSKVYKYSEAERIEQINNIKNLELVELVDGKAHAKSRVILRCLHDGFEWETTIDAITLSKSGCPRCAHNSWDLKQTLRYTYTWDFERWLYYIKFKNVLGQYFWKIGLSKGGTIGDRYKPNVLRKDGLTVVDYKTIKTNNLNATLTEYYVLTRYGKFSIDMREYMTYSKGGTECFHLDILKNSTLDNEIIKANLIKSDLVSEVETIKEKLVVE